MMTFLSGRSVIKCYLWGWSPSLTHYPLSLQRSAAMAYVPMVGSVKKIPLKSVSALQGLTDPDASMVSGYTFLCTYVCSHVLMYILMYLCMFLCTYVCFYLLMYVLMYRHGIAQHVFFLSVSLMYVTSVFSPVRFTHRTKKTHFKMINLLCSATFFNL